jgi:succinate dehydrogenase/fumarate reductase cytochrome b subunit
MAPYMMYHAHSFTGVILMIALWIVQLLVAVLIYRDAKEQKMLAPVWTVLGILPFFGYLVDVLYLIIRELKPARKAEPAPASL